MAENVFTQRFCDIVKKQICTTTADLNFDNYTAAGTYEIYESLDNGQNRVYFLTVDKSAGGNCTQTRTYCGKVEYRSCTNGGKWSEWESRTGGGDSPTTSDALVLKDIESGKAFKIFVSNGKLTMTETTSADKDSIVLEDAVSGLKYSLYVSSGNLMMKESED